MAGVACCSGSIDSDAIPDGVEAKIAGGVNCYYNSKDPTTPSPSGVTVIIVTDIFGWRLPNARLLADRCAARGYKCVVPDIFNGTGPPPDLVTSMELLIDPKLGASFLQKAYAVGRLMYFLVPFLISNSHAAGAEIIKKVITEVRQKEPNTKIFLTGYCWGGTIAVKLAADASLDIVGIYAAHAGGLKVPSDYASIRKPAAIVIAGNDFEVKEPQQKQIAETMKKNPVRSKVVTIADVPHGFAMRGSRLDPVVNDKRNEAEKVLFDFVKKVCG